MSSITTTVESCTKCKGFVTVTYAQCEGGYRKCTWCHYWSESDQWGHVWSEGYDK